MDFRKKALEIIQNKEALMVSGGGVLGLGEAGVLSKFVELGLPLKNIKKIKGSSVGSIISTAIACGADMDYINKTIDGMDLSEFRDHDFFLKSLIQLIFKYGLNKTERIRRFAGQILIDLVGNQDITFSQLYERTGVHLIITYLSMNLEKTIYADHLTEPDSSIREAIVKSSSIPLFYEGYFSGSRKNKQLAIDGGTLDNYSFEYLRDNVNPVHILGLKLVSREDTHDETNVGSENAVENIDKGSPKNVVNYFTRLIYLMRKQAMKIHVEKHDWMSSVKINVGNLTSTDFDLTPEQKVWLFQQGRKAADDYVDELTELLKEDKYPYSLPE